LWKKVKNTQKGRGGGGGGENKKEKKTVRERKRANKRRLREYLKTLINEKLPKGGGKLKVLMDPLKTPAKAMGDRDGVRST